MPDRFWVSLQMKRDTLVLEVEFLCGSDIIMSYTLTSIKIWAK